jgi:hypothetical protein
MEHFLFQRSHLRFHLNSKTALSIAAGKPDRTRVIIIVGERPTTILNKLDACDNLVVPFGSLRGCSGWLNKQLHVANVPEEKLFWLNAYDGFGKLTDLKKYVTLLNPVTTITLGNVASDECKKLNIEHEFYYHPQYWKRFRNKEQYPLINCLIHCTSKKL